MSKVSNLANEFDKVQAGQQEEVSSNLVAKSDFITYAPGEHLPKLVEKIPKKQINVTRAAAAFDEGESGNEAALLQQEVQNDGSAELSSRITKAKPTVIPNHRADLAVFQVC